jgi:hypothetical protein
VLSAIKNFSSTTCEPQICHWVVSIVLSAIEDLSSTTCEPQVCHRAIGHQIFAVYNLWTTGLPSCHIHCAIGYQGLVIHNLWTTGLTLSCLHRAICHRRFVIHNLWTTGWQVVDDNFLIADSTMEMVGIEMPRCWWLNWCLLFYERTKLLFPLNMRYHVLKAFEITCWTNSLGSEWWLMPYFGVRIPCFRVAPQPSIKFWLAIQARENDHQWPNLVFVFLSFE